MSKNDLTAPIDFESTLCREVPVNVGDTKYMLREATGKAASAYVSKRTQQLKLGKGNVLVGLGDVGSLAPFLVSMTLFDENEKPVPIKVIEAWPNRIQEALYDRALDLSGLREVDAQPIASMCRALEESGSPISFSELSEWVLDHTDPKDDKPLRSMIRKHLEEQEEEKEEAEGND